MGELSPDIFLISSRGFTLLRKVKFSVRDTSRLLCSRIFHHCRVFANRVSKMPLRRMREDDKNNRVCPAMYAATFS